MTVITKEDIENGNYTQDDILDYYDNLYYNNLHRDALKNLDEDQFDEITTHTEGNTTFTVGTLDGVSVIINEKKKSTIPFEFTKPDFTKVKQEASDLIQGIKNFSEGTRFGLVQAYNNTKILLNEASGGRLKQFEDIVNKAGKDFFDIDVKIPIESLRPENETIGTLGGEITGQYIIPGMFVYRYIPNILLAEPVVVGLFSGRDDGNLATAIKELAPNFAQNNEVAKIILDGLSVDADDTEIEARIKNVTADAPIGIVFSGLFSMLKYFKKNPEKLKEVQNEYKDAGAAATPDELKKNFKSTQPFYSNVVNAIREIDIPEGGMDVTQFTNTIRNTKGIKQSELDDMGFDEFFLDDKPAIVTQERVNEFLETRDLSKNVKTTVLGEDIIPATKVDKEIKRDLSFVPENLRNAVDYKDAVETVRSDDELYEEFMSFYKSLEKEAQTFLDPETNATVLLPKRNVKFDDMAQSDETEAYQIGEFLKYKYGVVKKTEGMNVVAPTKFDDYVIPGGEDYREMLLTTKGTQIFTKDHFRRTGANVPEGENILAHIRFNTRTIDGNKVLFVEEIQSDLHQAGRRKGYKDKQRRDEFEKFSQQLAKKYNLNPNHNLAMYADMKNMSVEEVNKYNNLQAKVNFLGIADAPFKKNWHELSMKRIIKYAIDNDFDGIALSTGEIQAQRYPGTDADFKVFYDQILPKFVNKFSKKYNTKLTVTTFDKTPTKPETIKLNTEYQLKNNVEGRISGSDKEGYVYETSYGGDPYEAFDFYDNLIDAQEALSEDMILSDDIVPYLKFTPEMINTIKSEGVPVAALEDRETSATRTV